MLVKNTSEQDAIARFKTIISEYPELQKFFIQLEKIGEQHQLLFAIAPLSKDCNSVDNLVHIYSMDDNLLTNTLGHMLATIMETSATAEPLVSDIAIKLLAQYMSKKRAKPLSKEAVRRLIR